MGRNTFAPCTTKLPELVKSKFSNAKANGDINFYPSQVAVVKPASIPFQLRFSPSLANKPTAPPRPPPSKPDNDNDNDTDTDTDTKPHNNSKKPAFDPFENPPLGTIVVDVGDDHRLILNKFAVVPEHSILTTRDFEPQTDLLDGGDLLAAHNTLRAYHASGGQDAFAFFNSGPHSGASQAHRHLQILPVDRMRDGLLAGGDGDAWGVLADRLVGPGDGDGDGDGGGEGGGLAPLLPFVTFSEKLEPRMSLWHMKTAYLRLYRKACRAVGGDAAHKPGEGAGATMDGGGRWNELEEDEEHEARISYNLAMTRDVMVILPRLAEGDVVRDAEGKEVGRLALNGTVLAGTALVKSQAEWDALRGDGGKQLWEILGKIGVRSGDVAAGGGGDDGDDGGGGKS